MKKHTLGLLAAAVLAVLATTAFALEAQKNAAPTSQADEKYSDSCTSCCCQK